jgi:hypothetical protein
MPGLVPGIHAFGSVKQEKTCKIKTWMAWTSQAMTKNESFSWCRRKPGKFDDYFGRSLKMA